MTVDWLNPNRDMSLQREMKTSIRYAKAVWLNKLLHTANLETAGVFVKRNPE